MTPSLCIQLALVLLALAPMRAPAAQSSFSLVRSLFDPGTNAQTGAQQGFCVALDGDLAVLGAPYDDVGRFNSGVVKVYNANTWALLLTLTNPAPAEDSLFGFSVAVSASRVVVGAIWDDTGANNAGRAYVYDLMGPTPTSPRFTLNNPTPNADDRFGQSVAIDGTRVVVGAHQDDTVASDSGAAYVYDLGSATPVIPALTLSYSISIPSNSFGFSVAISGMRVVVGAHRSDSSGVDSGSAFVYDLARPTPHIPVATLNNPGPARSDYFGYSTAISGTRVVIGASRDDTGASDAGSAYVYDLATGTPNVPVVTLTNPSPAFADRFGTSVAISGSWVVVGAEQDDTGAENAGSAYVYDLSSATPATPVLLLNNPSPDSNEYFGQDVAVSGMRLLIGAHRDNSQAFVAGAAYLYDLSGPTPVVPLARLGQPSPASYQLFGQSVAVFGARTVVGTPWDDTGAENAGCAYVYDVAGATPNVPLLKLPNPSALAGDVFGYSVSISGTRVVVGVPGADFGATNAGCAYVFDLAGATPALPVLTLLNPAPEADDNFGWPVAISGTRVVIGVPLDDTGARRDMGIVYVYDLAGAQPSEPELVLLDPSPVSYDNFGGQVSISGPIVAVGARFEPAGSTATGKVCVYDLSSAMPATPVLVLTNPKPVFQFSDGSPVALSGTRLLVGAVEDFTQNSQPGLVYVYELASVSPSIPVLTLTNPTPASNHWFGSAVALDGGRAVVGTLRTASGTIESGLAFVYDLDAPTPTTPVATLSNPTPARRDEFGASVAVHGGTIVIGAPRDDNITGDRGAAYVFALRPALRFIPLAPGFATLTWTPTNSPGFVLQHTDSLAHTNWMNAPSGAMNPATIPTTNSARVYRLTQP